MTGLQKEQRTQHTRTLPMPASSSALDDEPLWSSPTVQIQSPLVVDEEENSEGSEGQDGDGEQQRKDSADWDWDGVGSLSPVVDVFQEEAHVAGSIDRSRNNSSDTEDGEIHSTDQCSG